MSKREIVYNYLLKKCNSHGVVAIDTDEAIELTGLTRTAVGAHLVTLQKQGFIRLCKRGGGRDSRKSEYMIINKELEQNLSHLPSTKSSLDALKYETMNTMQKLWSALNALDNENKEYRAQLDVAKQKIEEYGKIKQMMEAIT